MKKKYYFYLNVFLLLMIITMLSFSASYAAFTSKATNANNTFTAAATFPIATLTPTPTPNNLANHIVINEVQPLGDDTKEWIELYNPTNTAVNVSGWSIKDNTSSDTFPTVSPIPSNGFGVIVGTANTMAIPSQVIIIKLTSPNIGNELNDSGDRVTLSNAAPTPTIIDDMSYGGDNTFITLTPIPASGQTYQRIHDGQETGAIPGVAADWHIANTTLGTTNQ